MLIKGLRNHYCTRDYGPKAPNQNFHHYSNKYAQRRDSPFAVNKRILRLYGLLTRAPGMDRTSTATLTGASTTTAVPDSLSTSQQKESPTTTTVMDGSSTSQFVLHSRSRGWSPAQWLMIRSPTHRYIHTLRWQAVCRTPERRSKETASSP